MMDDNASQETSSRLDRPKAPRGKIVLQAPPELEASDGMSTLLTSLVPLLGSVSAIVMMVMSNSGITGFLTGGMFMLSSLGFVMVNGVRQRTQRIAKLTSSRREYLAYLADLRKTVRTAAKKQRRAALWNAPEPSSLTAVAQEPVRRWERIPSDDDFLNVRIGANEQPLCITLEAPQLPSLAELDPVSASAAHRFMMAHENLKDLPYTIDLAAYKRIELLGDVDQAQSLARAMLCQAAVWQGPEYLKIIVMTTPDQRPNWQWLEAMPHAWSDNDELDKVDGHGPVMIATSVMQADRMIGEEVLHRSRFVRSAKAEDKGQGRQETLPHIIVVRDGSVPNGDGSTSSDFTLARANGFDGVTMIDLPEEWADLTEDDVLRVIFSQASIEIGLNIVHQATANQIEIFSTTQQPVKAVPDEMSIEEAVAVAARLEVPPETEEGTETGGEQTARKKSSELADLLGIADIHHLDLKSLWTYKKGRDRLRVPIGLNADTSTTFLDIKESAQYGMGPHGILIGATGSGKSEVLRTLVLSLALTHSPDQLNFVLIDFKGGATFAGMEGMPHISSIITNLGEEASLVDRMQDALTGEMTRRQELLRKAGNFANVSDYEKARLGGRSDLKPLPALLIVCDEFSELLSAKPEIVDSFVAIGRLGRSLEVHLLIASQRLEEGRLRGLDSHLSYRIGLRTFSASESRAVLGVPDAYTLPSIPGVGYLKPDPSTMIRFRASYVSGVPKGDPENGKSNFEIAVDQMRGKGEPAHQVWLPPLNVPNTLDEFFPDLQVVRGYGLISPSRRKQGYLLVPCALEDKPKEQKRDVLSLDLSGAGGHVGVVGGPLSGKSTFLRTMVASLALTHSPLETQFYVLDFGGGSFAGIEGLEHIAGVAMRGDDERVNRTLAEVVSIINARERYFKRNRIDSIGTYRQLRAQGKADDGYGEVFLVIDGWPNFRAEYEDAQTTVLDIVSRGLTFGVHVMISASRWMDIRTNIKDLIGTKVELRLGDPTDSEIDRRVAVNVPKGTPGRGLAQSKRHILVALPRIDSDHSPESLAAGVKDLVAKVGNAWKGPKPPKLRLLPRRLDYADFVRSLEPRVLQRNFILGVDEAELAPVSFNPNKAPHMYVFGDAKSGKSSFLRLIAKEIERYYDATGGKAGIFAVDYRRSMLGEISDKYLRAYMTNADEVNTYIPELAKGLAKRIPGSDVTAEQLRKRSWWTGSDAYFLIDDYDLVATSRGNPLTPLVPLLAQAGDIGLHVFVARRTGGASRALYDPVLQSFQDLGVTGFLLSGDPNEGPLIGKVKPKPLVPGRVQVVSRDAGTFLMQFAYPKPAQGGDDDDHDHDGDDGEEGIGETL